MSYSLLIYLVSYIMSDHELLNFKKIVFKSLPFNPIRELYAYALRKTPFLGHGNNSKSYELIFCRTPFPVISFDIKHRGFQQICPN